MSRLLTAAIALALASFGFSSIGHAVEPADSRAPLAGFELDDLNGESVSSDDFEGKVVVISFWATWCAPCLQELPFMQSFYEEHGPDDLVVLAVSTDGPDSISEARNIVRRNRWTMPVLLDVDGSVMAQLNPRGAQPFTIFVDRHGRVADTHEGFTVGDEIAHGQTIETLLAEE